MKLMYHPYMTNVSEIAAELQTALQQAQQSHKALEEAQLALQPLEVSAKAADERVSMLMNSYQQLTGFVPTPKRGRPAGSVAKKTRPARSSEAIIMTTASRALGQLHAEGKQKKAAITVALERAGVVASARGETLTDELKAQIEKKADSIWGSKSKS